MKTTVLTNLALFLLLCSAACSGKSATEGYVTFTADDIQSLRMSDAVATLEYSVNGGEWKELGIATVMFGGDDGCLQLRGKSAKGTDNATIWFGTDATVACSGDIRTLVDYENYTTADTEEASFAFLFADCRSLTSAPALPATTLAQKCYYGMFKGCTSLTSAPVLPATTLVGSCYFAMFRDCVSLTSAPVLPATTLAVECYSEMFYDCTSLTTAPVLPATTLVGSCYSVMFTGCTSLTSAPVLPAATLAGFCYYGMFSGCSSLSSITLLATDISESYCLDDWVRGVPETGTFVKAKEMNSLPEGESGIPVGWTVQDYEEE